MEIERELEIINKLGLHARAAAKFVKLASSFEAAVKIAYNGREVNGKSIMGVMMLAAARGSMVRIKVEGRDAELASEALTQLVSDRFGEGE